MAIAFYNTNKQDTFVHDVIALEAKNYNLQTITVSNPNQIYKNKLITDVFLPAINSPLNRKVIKQLKQRGMRVRHVQIGILKNPYNVHLPDIDCYYTFGQHWSNLLSKHNPTLKTKVVGSVKVDLIIRNRLEIKPLLTVVSQPTNRFIPNFSWSKYINDVRQWANKHSYQVVLRPHPNNKVKINVATNDNWIDFSCSACVCTLFSTLGLEAAAAGIPTFSYLPVVHDKIVDFIEV